jgi:ribonuclease BN (tRNA processing enzyme)
VGGLARSVTDFRLRTGPSCSLASRLDELATRAHPGLLILYHQSYQFNLSNEDDLMREIRAVYRGRFVSAPDLDVS